MVTANKYILIEAGMTESEADSIIGFSFDNDYSKVVGPCYNGIIISEWMCDEIKEEAEFKEGDLVVCGMDDDDTMVDGFSYMMTTKEGYYLCKNTKHLSSYCLFKKIKHHKSTTVLEDLIAYRSNHSTNSDFDDIIDKLKAEK